MIDRRNMVPWQFCMATAFWLAGVLIGLGLWLPSLLCLAVAVWAGSKIDNVLEQFGIFDP